MALLLLKISGTTSPRKNNGAGVPLCIQKPRISGVLELAVIARNKLCSLLKEPTGIAEGV